MRRWSGLVLAIRVQHVNSVMEGPAGVGPKALLTPPQTVHGWDVRGSQVILQACHRQDGGQ